MFKFCQVASLSLMICCGVSRVGAQTPAPAEPAMPAYSEETLSQLLGPEHRDEVNNFVIRLPLDVRIIKGANPDEMVSFVQADKQWGGSVTRAYLKTDTAPAQMLQKNSADLVKLFQAVQIQDSREVIISGKPAGRMIATMRAGEGDKSIMLSRCVVMIQLTPKNYFTVTFFAPATSAAEGLRTFDAMISTLQLLDPKQVAADRAKSVEEGRHWLPERTAEEAAAKLLKDPVFYRIRVSERDVGYMEMRERTGRYLNYDGINVDVQTHTFPSEARTNHSRLVIFWAFRRQPQIRQAIDMTMWTQATQTIVLDNRNATTGYVEEMGTMQMNPAGKWQITVTRSGDQPVGGENGFDKPLMWEVTPEFPSPMHKALEFLWPRFVDLSKPGEVIGGVVFNSAQSRLGLRKLRVIGPEAVILGGKKVNAVRLNDELESNMTMMWVDSSGRLLMMRTLDGTSVTPTTSDEMQRLWGYRLKANAEAAGKAADKKPAKPR